MVTKVKTKKEQEAEKKKNAELYPGIANASQISKRNSSSVGEKDRLELAQARASNAGISSTSNLYPKLGTSGITSTEEEQTITNAELEKQKADASQTALQEISKVPMIDVPTGVVDEFGNPVTTQLPVNQVQTDEKGINPFDVGTGAVAGAGSGVAAGFAAAAGATKIGAALGTAVAPGVGTAIGGAVGAVAGITAFLGKLALDEHQNVKELKESFTGLKTTQTEIIQTMKLDPNYREQAILDWQKSKASLYRIEQILHKKNSDSLTEFLGDPGDEYIEVESYLENLRLLDQQFAIAYSS